MQRSQTSQNEMFFSAARWCGSHHKAPASTLRIVKVFCVWWGMVTEMDEVRSSVEAMRPLWLKRNEAQGCEVPCCEDDVVEEEMSRVMFRRKACTDKKIYNLWLKTSVGHQ